MATNEREQRGMQIAQQESQIKRIDEKTYTVKSQSNKGIYEVLKTSLGWMCQCPDHVYRGVKCKHIFAVEFSQSLRAEVAVSRIIPEIDIQACRYCGSSDIVKDGIRHNKHGDLQIYSCRSCGHYFTINIGFERMRATPQIITSAMQLYFTGESLRNVQKFLRLQGVKVSHVAILKWIKKYVALMVSIWRRSSLTFQIHGEQMSFTSRSKVT